MLAVMGPDKLARAMFPLGEVASKQEVRNEAAARLLGVSNKPDSYDICFVADGDTKGFLERALGEQPGQIEDESGVVVGAHSGAYAYTVGQRKGLGIGNPAPDGAPRYVTAVDTSRNVVTVGPETLLSVSVLTGDQTVWLAPDVPADGSDGNTRSDGTTVPTPCHVQVRAHGEPVPGTIVREGAHVRVELESPMRGVAAGQSLVAYQGTRVLGQATITR